MGEIPIIPLGNDSYAIKKNPADSSATSLRTKTSRMHKRTSLTELQLKEKLSYTSSIGVESSWVSTEVDYTTTIDPDRIQEYFTEEELCKNILD